MQDPSSCPACFLPKAGTGPCGNCGYDAEKFPDTNVLPPGALLAERYVVGGLLGQGGFGATYRGYDTRLASMVALMVMPFAGERKMF